MTFSDDQNDRPLAGKAEKVLEINGPLVVRAREKFTQWCTGAAHSRLAPFKKLAGTIRRHLDGILAFIATGLSNGPIEGLNGKIRTITRRAYGFHIRSPSG